MDGCFDLLKDQWRQARFLCVELDTDYQKLPVELRKLPADEALFRFNRAIVEATAGHCAAFKPNSAFYEGYGPAGIEALIKTNEFIRENYPRHLIILDA